ncbi:MAG TPA: hypothetical protein VGK00_01545 [Anaerolineales bacterium]|jgi:hypothetical protein
MKTFSHRKRTHPFEAWLALFAAAACLVITVRLWNAVSATQGMWPFPALYFIEMPLLAVLAAIVVMFDTNKVIPWIVTGALAAFGVLGAMTVGIFYLAIALIFAVVSITVDVRASQPNWVHLAFFLLAALLQAGFIILAANLF